MKKEVFVFVEKRKGKIQNVSLELISESRKLLNEQYPVKALFLTDEFTAKDIKQLSSAGATEVIVLKSEKLGKYDTTNYTEAIANYFEEFGRPDIFLVGSTLVGRDLAPRVSAKIQTGLTADATVLEFEETEEKIVLNATRPAFGGNLYATILCSDHYPQMSSIRPGVFDISDSKNEAKVTELKAKITKESKVKVLKSEKLPQKEGNLEEAKVVIDLGRGVSQVFDKGVSLAKACNGEVGASRGLVDLSIASKDNQVGQTGANIKAKVCLSLGVSGAVQHLAGLSKVETLIAVNTDPNAAIFDQADVSIICDAKKVIPLVEEEINRLKNHKK